jgi:hypothetical protein
MLKTFKKFIFAFILLGLLCDFVFVTNTNFSAKNLEIADFETDKESSESENLDLENIKFFSQSNYNPQISLASLAIKKNHSNILSKNFLAIPTSPPKSCTKTRIS